MKKILPGLALLLALLPGLTARAQSAHRFDSVLTRGANVQANVVPYATIRVCAQGSTGTPCTPLASVFYDAALTQPIPQPLPGVVADASGNFSYYTAALCVDEQYSAPGQTARTVQNICLTSDVSGAVLLAPASTQTVTQPVHTALNLNGQLGFSFKYDSFDPNPDAFPTTPQFNINSQWDGPGHDCGSGGSNATTCAGWTISLIAQSEAMYNTQGISGTNIKEDSTKVGDHYDGRYVRSYGGDIRAGDEGVCPDCLNATQRGWESGLLTAGTGTGSTQITAGTLACNGSCAFTSSAHYFADGGILLDTHAAVFTANIVSCTSPNGTNPLCTGTPDSLGGLSYLISGTTVTPSTAYGLIQPATCTGNGTGQLQAYVSTTCTVTVLSGSFNTASHLFTSGPYSEEAQITSTSALSGGLQTLTFLTRYAYNTANSEPTLVMQGGPGGSALIGTNSSGWPVAYPIIGAETSTRINVSNCASGDCAGGTSSNLIFPALTDVLNYTVSGGTLTRSGGTVTYTNLNFGTGNLNLNALPTILQLPAGSTIVVSGWSPSDLNGTFTVLTNTMNPYSPTMTWAQAGSGETSSVAGPISQAPVQIAAYPSAYIIGTNLGQQGVAQLATNHVTFALNDTLVGAPTSEYHQYGRFTQVGQATSQDGANASTADVIQDVGPIPQAFDFQANNLAPNGAVAPAMFSQTGLYATTFSLQNRPRDGAALFQIGNNTPSTTPYLLFKDQQANASLGYFPATNNLVYSALFSAHGLDAQGQKGTNFAAPVATTDAATKSYVDSAVGGIGAVLLNPAAPQTIAQPVNTNFAVTTSGTGLVDFSGALNLKLPVVAGYNPTASGECGHDSTGHNFLCFDNGVSNYVMLFPTATPPVNGDLALYSVSGGTVKLADSGNILPNGTQATTQTAGDSTTKVATDAFVTTAAAAAIPSTCPLSNANNICVTSAPYNSSPNGTTTTTTSTTFSVGTSGAVASCSTFNPGNGVYIPGAGPAGRVYSFTMNASGSAYTVGDVLTITQGGASGGTITILAITAATGAPITQYDSKTGDIGYPVQFGLSAAGTGYTVASNLATTGGTGTGFRVNIVEVAGYVGTVVSCTGTTLTVTPATSTSVGGGTLVKHDEAAAFTAAQAALATTNAGGLIWIPCGNYEFSSALQDPTGANAVLPMPKLPNSIFPVIQIGYRGCTVPGVGTPFGGTTLQTTAVSGNFIGGYDAVVGGGVPPFTNVWFDPDYITFVTPSNSAVVIINATAIINSTLGTVTTETTNNSLSTTPLSAGYMSPGLGNNVRSLIHNLTVGGVYNGVLLSEHTTADYIAMNAVTNCYVFDSGFTPNTYAPLTYTGNPITIAQLWAGNCVYPFVGNLRKTMISVTAAGIENASSNGVNDASNLLHGSINYDIVYPSGVTSSCNLAPNGGTGLVLFSMQCGTYTNIGLNTVVISGGTMDGVTIGATTPEPITATSATVFLNQNAATQIVLANHNAGTGSVSQLAVQSDVGNVGLGFTSSTYTAAPADVGYLNVGTQTSTGGKSFDGLFQGVPIWLYNASLFQIKSGIPLCWGTIPSTGTTAPTQDLGVSRDAAGVLDLGSCTQGDKSGTLKATTITLTGVITANQFLGGGSTPTCSAGAAAGTGATCSVTTGTNTSGRVSITTGTATTASAVLATITWSGTIAAPQACPLTPTNVNSVGQVLMVYPGNPTTTTLPINVGGSAVPISTTYTYSYGPCI